MLLLVLAFSLIPRPQPQISKFAQLERTLAVELADFSRKPYMWPCMYYKWSGTWMTDITYTYIACFDVPFMWGSLRLGPIIAVSHPTAISVCSENVKIDFFLSISRLIQDAPLHPGAPVPQSLSSRHTNTQVSSSVTKLILLQKIGKWYLLLILTSKIHSLSRSCSSLLGLKQPFSQPTIIQAWVNKGHGYNFCTNTQTAAPPFYLPLKIVVLTIENESESWTSKLPATLRVNK